MRSKRRSAILGAFLGLWVPLGCLALRMLHHRFRELAQAIPNEWRQSHFYYFYMAVFAVFAFAAFGYLLGELNEEVDDLVITDGLTKTYNHRHLQEQLGHEMERSHRYKTPLSCLMLDMDDFRKLNDHLGHSYGDVTLVTVSRLITEAVRHTDIVGRYGGEEFLIIMPETGEVAAAEAAGRIMSAIRSNHFGFDDRPVTITVSIGLATYPGGARADKAGLANRDGLLAAAEQALQQAKRNGKDRVVVWNPKILS